MPLLDPSVLKGHAFLYPNAVAAREHSRVGGSAFLVGRPVRNFKDKSGQERFIPYLVTNLHVVHSNSAVARFNRIDGTPEIVEFSASDWIPHPMGCDVAAVCMYGRWDAGNVDRSFTSTDNFITQKKIEDWKIGIGDEVFMVGRFLNHQGKNLIRPAARFGSISMMLEDIWHSSLAHYEESFAVEMRSRTGFSGAPVHVYRSGATNISTVHPIDWFFGLLGINWGYIIEKETSENTWLNGVVPAWKITETLETPILDRKHEEAEAHVRLTMTLLENLSQ